MVVVSNETQQKKPRKAPKESKKQNNKKNKKEKKGKIKGNQAEKKKQWVIRVPMSKKANLVDAEVMRKHNFLSRTDACQTSIHKLVHVEGDAFEVEETPTSVSTRLPLVLKLNETNELARNWTEDLWNISQQVNIQFGDEDVHFTFVRAFERQDSESAKRKLKKNKFVGKLSTVNEDSIGKLQAGAIHDQKLRHALETGDSVVSFGGEAMITAPNVEVLETAMRTLKAYIKGKDGIRGLNYQMDINKQGRPFLLYGPTERAQNGTISCDMTSLDAGVASMIVDTGGRRSLGSEYVGFSVGKLITSRAAYNLMNNRTMLIGNARNHHKTYVQGTTLEENATVYLSKVISRSYLLNGQQATHFVFTNHRDAEDLMKMPVKDERKCVIDASDGVLNLLEPFFEAKRFKGREKDILSLFPQHIGNIIALLTQFRDVGTVAANDDFANAVRQIAIDFYVDAKKWRYDAQENLHDIRMIGVQHEDWKMLHEFGEYIQQKLNSSKHKSEKVQNALEELNMIVNGTILPTIPLLNAKTSDQIDGLVHAGYRVVDLSSVGGESIATDGSSALHAMTIAYFNLLFPTFKNGDVLVLHGGSRIKKILPLLEQMINNAHVNIDLVVTDDTPENALQARNTLTTSFDLEIVELYRSNTEKLYEPLGIDASFAIELKEIKASYFFRDRNDTDFVYVDLLM